MRSLEVIAMETGAIKPVNSTQAFAAMQNASKGLARLDGINAKRVEPVKNTSESLKTRQSIATLENKTVPDLDKKQAEIVAQAKAPEIAKETTVTRGYVINPDVGIVYQETDERTGDVVEQLPSERELARRVYEKKANQDAKISSSHNLPSTVV